MHRTINHALKHPTDIVAVFLSTVARSLPCASIVENNPPGTPHATISSRTHPVAADAHVKWQNEVDVETRNQHYHQGSTDGKKNAAGHWEELTLPCYIGSTHINWSIDIHTIQLPQRRCLQS